MPTEFLTLACALLLVEFEIVIVSGIVFIKRKGIDFNINHLESAVVGRHFYQLFAFDFNMLDQFAETFLSTRG